MTIQSVLEQQPISRIDGNCSSNLCEPPANLFPNSLESGKCTASGLNRQKINRMVHQLDRDNVITRPMISLPGYSNVETIATDRAWNGRGLRMLSLHKRIHFPQRSE